MTARLRSEKPFGNSAPYLMFGFALIITLMGGVAVLGLERLQTLNAKVDLLRLYTLKTEHVQRMRTAVRERFIRLGLIVSTDDPFLQDEYHQEFELLASRFMVARAAVEGMVKAEDERELFQALRALTTAGSPVLNSVVEHALAGDNEQAKAIMFTQSVPIQERVMAQTDKILSYFEQANAAAVAAVEQEQRRIETVMTAMTIAQVLLAMLIAGLVIRHARIQQQGVDREIARRRETEAQLREAQEGLERQVAERSAELSQVKSTLDRTLDCVFMFDADTLRFFYANEGALKQVGYTREELMAMHPYDIKPDFGVAQFHALIEPLRNGSLPSLTFETVHQHKHGQRVPVEIFLQHIARAGESARFIAIVRDITERKRIERMKNEFVSTVSHELRTPLTSIAGALGLVQGGVLGELSPQARQMIEIAHKNSERLGNLINDLLDMEKLMAGKMAFDLQVQPLMPLVEQALADNRPYAEARGVHFELGRRADEACVRADTLRLQQVLANLLSNAVKFSPAGCTVDVRVQADGERVRVAVEDCGPGIPETFRARIFEKFSQADASDARQKGGTGLGLAISRELVERMGGRIGFESVEGAGATFYFDLPLEPCGGVEALR